MLHLYEHFSTLNFYTKKIKYENFHIYSTVYTSYDIHNLQYCGMLYRNVHFRSMASSLWAVVVFIRQLPFHLSAQHCYSLFTFSWPQFESGSLRNGGMLILRIYFAVDGMPIEVYGESWIAGLLTSDDIMLYMAGFGTT